MPRKGLEHVKTVRRNGKAYYYFNSGLKNDGKPVYVALPDKADPSFGTAYASCLAARTRRMNMPKVLTVPGLVSLYEKSPELRSRSQGTQRAYGIYLKQFAHAFNTAPANSVEQSDIYDLIDDMADRPAAADMMLLVVRGLYRWGRKRKHVSVDPTYEIEALDAGGEYAPWPESLIELALQDPAIRLPVAILYYTAQRIGDACRIGWNDIRNGILYVTQQKTGKALEIPVHARLQAILDDTPRLGLTVLTGPGGKRAQDQTVRLHLKRFGDRHGVKVVPHGLRKNAVIALLEAGCSTAETSAISGQSLKMIEHYSKGRNSARMGRAAILKWEKNG